MVEVTRSPRHVPAFIHQHLPVLLSHSNEELVYRPGFVSGPSNRSPVLWRVRHDPSTDITTRTRTCPASRKRSRPALGLGLGLGVELTSTHRWRLYARRANTKISPANQTQLNQDTARIQSWWNEGGSVDVDIDAPSSSRGPSSPVARAPRATR